MDRSVKAVAVAGPSPKAVVDEKVAAAYVNLSVKTLQARRAAHKSPAFLKIGRSIRYKMTTSTPSSPHIALIPKPGRKGGGMSNASHVDFSRVNAAAQAQAEAVCRELLPGGRVVGNEYVAGDINGGPGDSFRVNLTTGRHADFAGDVRGGDFVSLLANKRGTSQVDAARELARRVGVGTDGSSPRPKPEKAEDLIQVAPAPADAPEPPTSHSRHGRPSTTWTYRDGEGRVLFHVYRFDPDGGKKEVLPVTLWRNKAGRVMWRFKGYTGARPLYGLDLLAKASPTFPVLLGEGEKTADAASRLLRGAVSMTWPGGGKAVSKVDFGPLAGRRVMIWPDADKPGFEAALDVAARVMQAGVAEVYIIAPPKDVAEGWDLADAEAEGWTGEKVIVHIQANKLTVAAFTSLARERHNIECAIEPPGDEATDAIAGKPGLVVLDLRDFLSLDIKPREFIISPVIPCQGLVMVYAARGIGKTHFALHLSYAVASGQMVFRWKAATPRRVLYIDGEMPASAMQERIAGIVASYHQEPTPGFMRIITPDTQPDFMPNLATPEGQAAIAPYLEGVDLLVVDNLATLCRAGRENESEGWLPVQEWILSLRRRGMSALLVHHANKGGGQRGTSSREDVLDTVISLRRPQDYRPEEGARFEVHLEKARGIIGDDAKPFEARLIQNGDALVWACRDIEDMELEMVARLHTDGLPIRDIAEETGLSKSKVGRLVKRLKQGAA